MARGRLVDHLRADAVDPSRLESIYLEHMRAWA
jgi:hypothetical protein